MPARKKKKAPTRKTSTGKAAAPRGRTLPNDDAWRKLVATALEKRVPDRAPAKSGSTTPARKKAPKK